MTTITVPEHVLDNALDVLAEMGVAWQSFTCREADHLARLLDDSDRHDDATRGLALHATADTAQDGHPTLVAAIRRSDGQGYDAAPVVQAASDHLARVTAR